MATAGPTSINSTTKEPKQTFIRELYFHIQGRKQLILERADSRAATMIGRLPTNSGGSGVYHTVQCAQNTTLIRDRCIALEDVDRLKCSLKDFMKKKEAQLHDESSTIRLEARFGHLLFMVGTQSTCSTPVTTEYLQAKHIKKKFIVNGLRTLDNVAPLIKEGSNGRANPESDAITFNLIKVRFSGEFRENGSKFEGICYVKEELAGGRFKLQSTHDGKFYGNNDFRIDISRPGMTYDIRLAAYVYEDKDGVNDHVLQKVAEEITRSMKRSSSGEFRMQLVGSNWTVNYLRESKKMEYKLRIFPRWTLADCDVCEFTPTSQNQTILRRDHQFRDIPITYDSHHKEIELWSNIHEEPKTDREKWITESDVSPEAGNFEEFVGTCFDIVNKLE